LVTCNHVVPTNGVSIKIKLNDQAVDFFDAKVAIRDEKHDIAILEYNPALAPNSESLQQIEQANVTEGMEVLFSGYPLDLSNLTTHQGILSAILKDPTGVTLYMIDGTVNPGNSGCPLLSKDGLLVGVVNARRRENNNVLNGVEGMQSGALSLYGVDIVTIYKAVISNLQLGIGYAIPCSYIPSYGAGVPSVEEPPVSKRKVEKMRKK
jgi:S1-C subfamily serine protease